MAQQLTSSVLTAGAPGDTGSVGVEPDVLLQFATERELGLDPHPTLAAPPPPAANPAEAWRAAPQPPPDGGAFDHGSSTRRWFVRVRVRALGTRLPARAAAQARRLIPALRTAWRAARTAAATLRQQLRARRPDVDTLLAALTTAAAAWRQRTLDGGTPASAFAALFLFGAVLGGSAVWLVMARPVAAPLTGSPVVAHLQTASAAGSLVDAAGPAAGALDEDAARESRSEEGTSGWSTGREEPRRSTGGSAEADARTDDGPAGQVVFRGSLRIASQPAGATVYLNGEDVGLTPLVLDRLPVGSRAVRVELEGFAPWSSAVQVVASRETRVTAMLEPR